MVRHSRFLCGICVVSVWVSTAGSELDQSHLATAVSGVHPVFNLEAPNSGPFPSDWFTVEDRDQNTGLRVNLPMPECGDPPITECSDVEQLNELDGFNMQPRLSIPFDGNIDVDGVTSETIFLLKLSDHHDVQVVGINQTVWDPETLTLHVESDELLDQHTRYALVVTTRVLDSSGNPIGASEEFRRFRQTVPQPYKQALLDTIHAARRIGIREDEIAAASVFTTQSATAVLEKIRDQILAAPPEPADFLLGAGGTRTVFPFANMTDMVFRRHTGVSPDMFSDTVVTFESLRFIPGAVGQIAFGSYVAPQYRVSPGLFIPAMPTRTGVPEVQFEERIYFNLYLPSGSPPAAGWPVVLFGIGGGAHKETNALRLIGTAAAAGIATLVINPVGHGLGPRGTLTARFKAGSPVTFPAGGRGQDVTGDRVIGAFEGFAASQRSITNRDAHRQTAADLMQLVRVIKLGIDVDGDTVSDLDSSRIYYHGRSNGGFFGAVFMAVEPDVRAGVLGVLGGFIFELRLSPGQRSGQGMIGGRVPTLINPPGITHLDQVPLVPAFFNENMPLRDGVPYQVQLENGASHVIRAPTINSVQGAMAIQEVFERYEWIQGAGEAAAYAPHISKAPLPGMSAKSVLCQIAKADQVIPNPSSSTFVRAGGLTDRTTYYRHDLAFAEDPTIPKSSHSFALPIDFPDPLRSAIARGAQHQIAVFLATDGVVILHPEPLRFFETPISSLPEGLNFILSKP